MAKTFLSEEVKEFIVINLAKREYPSDVSQLVEKEYGIKISRQGVHAYNPTRSSGKNLSEKLKELFFDTRKKYDAERDAEFTEYWKRGYP